MQNTYRKRSIPHNHVLDETLENAWLAQIFAHRGESLHTMQYDWSYMPDPLKLKNMPEVLERLVYARTVSMRIVIVGDYDTDGATSISIMVAGLRKLGYDNVDYVVPHRFIHGYGLTCLLVPTIMSYQPDMVITVDNGIQSVEAVDMLTALGVEVIITDHHLPGPIVPRALIINPNLQDCPYEEKNIAGCGVAWCVMVALRSRLKNSMQHPVHFNDLTIYAALGTVADCVRLTHANRILVQKGLELIRAGHAPWGVKALMQIASVRASLVTSGDIAFRLAPRLNASGRLEDMSLGVRCLLSEDESQAIVYARELDALNMRRQAIQADMQEQALAQIDFQASCHVLFDASWHQGIIGLIASRVREVTKCPTLAFAWDDAKSCYKGSGRSIPGVHLKYVLDAIAHTHPHVMINFGGHAQAVGLSIGREHFALFRELFMQHAQQAVASCQVMADIVHDGVLPEKYLDITWFESLYQQHPFGQGFEEPIYCTPIQGIKVTESAKGHYHVQGHSPYNKQPISGWIFKASPFKSDVVSERGWIVFQYMGQYKKNINLKILAYLGDENSHLLAV